MPAVRDRQHQELTLSYATLKDSRDHLSEVLDTAHEGLMVSIFRGRSHREARAGSVSVIKTAVLQEILEKLVADSVEWVYNDGDQLHTVAIRGLPLAAEAEDLPEAVRELVEDIRDYEHDWITRLRFAPNHEGNFPLVYLAQSMTDDELYFWLRTQMEAGA
jgi:Antitoxin of toxin-antitoxin, RelE / RelB, TA system